MPWLVSTQFCLLCGVRDQSQGIAHAARARVLTAPAGPQDCICIGRPLAQPDSEALVPPAGRAVGPSSVWDSEGL